MNYFELDAASNNSVDNIRELVDQIRFLPQTGKYKVYVIDEVHMLSQSAFNAFLKTLEEPPSYAIFILATTEKHKILPTILSRCQIFDFRRITTADTVHHLEEICEKEEIKADKAALQVIAQKSEGCMRDALSILDKIVSFTNGELNYANTLEHLNILDEDVYFKLLNFMQEQDLSGALLLYDDINRKGFEGDIVLNGFSEFIRNLLVCQDERAAGLLEVVESFRDKYIQVSKQISPALLISALNILNDAEINYKAARNKRLHVELSLIKLCYLQQAVELSSGDTGISKKKLVGKPQAFRTASIQAFTSLENKKPSGKQESAKIIIEIPPAEKENKVTETPAASTGGKLSALNKIRQQYTDQNKEGSGQLLPLNLEDLQKAWLEYVAQLRDEKNPAAQPFEQAQLRIHDENSFEVVTSNTVEKQFIEQSRNGLFSFLKDKLSNRLLKFTVTIDEARMEKRPVEITLSASEQYQKMIEMYPAVKELKDKLNLTLDY